MPTIAEASRITEKLVGHAAEPVTAYLPPYGGDASFCFRCHVSGRQAFLKINKAQTQPIGVYYHRRLREAGIPVPELIAFSADAGPDGQACALFEWVEGTPAEVDDSGKPPYDEAELGTVMRAIHGIAHDRGFGPLDDNGQGSFASWPDALVAAWRLDACIQRGAIDAALGERLSALPYRFADELAATQTCLLHCEDIMQNGNLILGPNGRIVAVIDFAGAMAGDPLWELMWFDYYFGEYGDFGSTPTGFDLARFKQAYGITYDPWSPRQQLYLLGALLDKLSWLPLAGPRAAHHQGMVVDLVERLEG